MLILECTSSLQPYIYIAKLLVTIIQIAVPILLVVLAMIEIFKAVTSKNEEEMKKAKKSLINRIISALIIWLVVPFVIFILNVISKEGSSLEEFTSCWDNPGDFNLRKNNGTTIIERPDPIIDDNNNIDEEEKPILPSSSANVVASINTKSLIFSVEKVTKDDSIYHITRIWMKDPYKQLNKMDSPEYGKKLYRPNTLFEYAIQSKELTDKAVIAFNASGFYSQDFETGALNIYSGYNNTAVGTIVITDGKVIRNVWDKPYRTRTIAGVTKEGSLTLFTDKAFNSKNPSSSELNQKKKWAEEVINSGIRNTFTFASPLIEKGVASTDVTNMPEPNNKRNRQAICQIDHNNYVLITSFQEEYSQTRNDLISIMLELGCKTGTNLDGGGSVALLYKEAGSNEIKVIGGGHRSLPEIGYFTEL